MKIALQAELDFPLFGFRNVETVDIDPATGEKSQVLGRIERQKIHRRVRKRKQHIRNVRVKREIFLGRNPASGEPVYWLLEYWNWKEQWTMSHAALRDYPSRTPTLPALPSHLTAIRRHMNKDPFSRMKNLMRAEQCAKIFASDLNLAIDEVA
jgi:hypothetical protein